MLQKIIIFRNSLIVKISALAALCVLLLIASLVYISYIQQRSQYFNELQMQFNMVSKPVLENVDELEKVKALLLKNKDADRTQPEISLFQKMLDEFSGSEGIANTYLLYPDMKEENGKSFLASMLNNQALYDAGVSPLIPYEMPDYFKTAANKAIVTGFGMTDVYSDEYGTWVSMLRSIKDKSGKTVALMGIDFDYAKFNSEMRARLINTLFVGLIFGCLAVAAICFVVALALKPVRDMIRITRLTAEGDLSETLKVKRNDEFGLLGTSFNQMIYSLRSVLVEVSESSNQLAASSEQLSASAEQTSKAIEHIAGTVEQMADGANQQVHTVKESANTIHEVSTKIQQIARNAKIVAETTTKAAEKSSEGGKAIQTAAGQMSSISISVDGLAQVINHLASTSLEIGQITGAITEIANQTNLLSLNAAIEAARAGEHGRGFAVVANEVKKLAAQSSKSAEQIAELIQAIRSEIENAQTSMKSATKEVSVGMEVVQLAGNLFAEIERFVADVNVQVREVSSASGQISEGTQQVVHAIERIAGVAQLTASGTENVSAATEEQLAFMQEISSSSAALTHMAGELQGLVENFKL
ncbi:HAMP domain-containing protein [Cohnella sp. CFH 77786]|uniref:methyl-accepting chemotaxis protein n=1 Tax=Cohnella sp. CFH 77786 TaxID=2662265 RepID=UPI001C60D0D7|nr:HAMP domain-containing methyl-accepting chemotaxis protein [Cohnella sp. CFH 77786]MBW5446868.1 HAMP domain-containing protein [Cohnella sp. CFH 77786]